MENTVLEEILGWAEGDMRILADVWHVMNRVELSRRSPLIQPFFRSFSLAIFNEYADDVAAVKAVLAKKGVTYEEMIVKSPSWVYSRVRREAPKREIMKESLLGFRAIWENEKDPATGQPIFNTDVAKAFNNILKLVEKGHLSDPEGVQLYYPMGEDENGLQQWRCIRGSSINESIHNKIRESLDTENCSIELGDLMLAYFISVYNQRAAIRNIPGTPDEGHFDMGLTNKTNDLYERLTGRPFFPTTHGASRNKLFLSGERTGVSKLFTTDPSEQLPKVQGTPWENYKNKDIIYISKVGGSKIPALPVTTKEEHDLYKDLVRQATTGRNSTTPAKINWAQMAVDWDQYVDGVNIYRKKAIHLSGYHKTMEASQQKKGHLRQMKNRNNNPLGLHTATARPRPEDSSDSSSGDTSSDSGDDNDEERAAAIARSTLPGPPPYVPATVLGNATAPRTTLTSTIPLPQPSKRTRTCAVCKSATCAGTNLRERCPQYHDNNAGLGAIPDVQMPPRPVSAPPSLELLNFTSVCGQWPFPPPPPPLFPHKSAPYPRPPFQAEGH